MTKQADYAPDDWETLRRHDAKARLAQDIATEPFGECAAGTASILVLPSTSTARRRAARHDAVLRAACPLHGGDLRA
jgi:hypothetical protein